MSIKIPCFIWENKKIPTVVTASKFNRAITDRGKIDTVSWLGRGSPIKSGVVEIDFCFSTTIKWCHYAKIFHMRVKCQTSNKAGRNEK